ncbi:hypothetical protein OG871_39550 (plasmid) [Kitasatospora sp. NBC_00374]|uniref:hypothetical protein n=1 Tax=Kitasatospora sp. NBC_00374 TaxID=2975964 RepID=UPI00324330EC
MTDDQKAATSAGDSTGGGVDLADEVHYPPVENGLDYLVSVVDHLQGGKVGRRSLKYAVVHLQAATECLLKHRLELEHWSLVFKSPGDAKRSKLDDGSLTTCTVDQTITRLTDIVGVAISDLEKTKLTQLADLRNRLQHYGRHHDPKGKVNRYEIEANATFVLEFLINFLNTQLLDRIPLPDADVLMEMSRVSSGLDEIRGYVTARMARLRGELDLVKSRTVQCPECDQLALVAGDEEDACCRYCLHRGAPDAMALNYAREIVGRGELDWSGWELVGECPLCDVLALVRGAITAADPENPVDLCFNCGENLTGLEECTNCGNPFQSIEGQTACHNCLSEMINDGT